MSFPFKYAESHFSYKRVLSREVYIGDVPLGAHHPIRIQSMTTTDTMDTISTVEQSLRMVEAGCEYVRITAPSKKEAQNLAEIKKELRKRGCKVPLVADIHYTPNAAEIAARIVEKVRVNPGNYADKKRFETLEYTDQSYQDELDRIYKRFSPLVKIAKEEGTTLRIGTNHGSLSDRIMSRYGDTPLGMVESAMEFVRICEDHNFRDLVISMKASNPQVMVQAYRMLMEIMIERQEVYPLHLGVTEAGEGEDGRIKSALGISTLLMDGIGDTVRVSLTEEPEYEMPVARFLVDLWTKGQKNGFEEKEAISSLPFDPYSFNRKVKKQILNIGGTEVPRVACDIGSHEIDPDSLGKIGYTYIPALDKYNFSDISSDIVFVNKQMPGFEFPGGLKRVMHHKLWEMLSDPQNAYPFFDSLSAFGSNNIKHPECNFVKLGVHEISQLKDLAGDLEKVVGVISSEQLIPSYEWRKLIYQLLEFNIEIPVFLQIQCPDTFEFYDDSPLPAYLQLGEEAKMQLYIASIVGTLLVDGLVDGLWMDQADKQKLSTAFASLQLSRQRITKTEYISCPSCGRTLFDLQETTARIRQRTEHLKGVKIGIMGCIVNGPGEMADADYGYVGVGPGKIALYRGQTVVEKAVKTEEAVDKLIELIKTDGNWIDLNPNEINDTANATS